MKVDWATWEAHLGGGSRQPPLPGKPAAQVGVGEAHGTDEAGNDGGGTGPHFWVPHEAGKDRGIDVSLETPEKIGNLQKGLYAKAKAEPAFRFYLLYDKVYREDILEHAYRLARSNGGAPGVDRVNFADIETAGLEKWLASLREELRTETYKPSPVRRSAAARGVRHPVTLDGGEPPELLEGGSVTIWSNRTRRSSPTSTSHSESDSDYTTAPAAGTIRSLRRRCKPFQNRVDQLRRSGRPR